MSVTTTSFFIGSRPINDDSPIYVIAELSANHGGSLDIAKRTVEAAARAGADAIKLQTYTPDTMTLRLDRPPFVVGDGTPWSGRQLYDLYAEAMTPWDWHEPLFQVAKDCGIDCFSSPFDATAIEFLRDFNPPAVKIASFELTDHPLIAQASTMGIPVIMSTGMATEGEISEAISVAKANGAPAIALLRCNSAYPAKTDEMDLATIGAMRSKWGLPVGLSDHTLSDTAAIVAVSLGATILEKHFILERSIGGPDSSFSLEPGEFSRLVRTVRDARASLGTTRFGPSPSEVASTAFRRSLWVTEDVKKGDAVGPHNVRALRPAGGLHTRHLSEIVGKRFVRDCSRGTPMSLDCIE